MATPWMTSDDLVAAVKRKISFPSSQSTFTDTEILAFANEEMAISQVPAVMSFHEEYFVTTTKVTIESNKNRYPIPERAIGMKLRDLFWEDDNGNIFEMTKVSEEDRAFFQRNIGANQAIHKYLMEGNDIILTPLVLSQPTGKLLFVYFLRPNQLVSNNKAAIISSFGRTITVDNTSLVAGNTVTINSTVFTAVGAAPTGNQFLIGGTSAITATNLNTVINVSGVVASAISGTVLTLTFSNRNLETTTTNSSAFVISSLKINFSSIPINITNGSIIDFLQTRPGHKTMAFSVSIPSSGVSGNTISFTESDIPADLIVGDYIASENECIIPQIPSDLHNGLAERSSARILAALGDREGLQVSIAKIQEIAAAEGPLLDNRVEGSPIKITSRHSLLRYNKSSVKRRI